MVSGYGEQPQPNQQVATQPQGGYPDDYYYQGNTFSGMTPNDQAAQVRKAIFECELPTEDDDFGKWIPMLITAVDMVARIPGIDKGVVFKLNRRMEDIVDRSHSQGRKRIVASKMQKLIFRLRSYVSMGDTQLLGMTGVTAMITTNTNQKTEVRMPQQPQAQGFWPWSRRQS
jgi:hypothetical protein